MIEIYTVYYIILTQFTGKEDYFPLFDDYYDYMILHQCILFLYVYVIYHMKCHFNPHITVFTRHLLHVHVGLTSKIEHQFMLMVMLALNCHINYFDQSETNNSFTYLINGKLRIF